ncbi:MAG: alpha/beta hydrolase [Chloroflexi bacterium]|nr:alpha/beta hydrolase [Chloroflexota bacterium]
MTNTSQEHAQSGYASVNGLELYYEIHGSGEPLVLLHGGLGVGSMFGDVLTSLSQSQQVIAVDLQAHGRTADIDRPLRYEHMADDIAALIQHLGFTKTNVMGYSLGGGVALRTAIQHPELVKKLVLISAPFKQSGWFPEVVAGMAQVNASGVEFMRETPMYQSYMSVAPKPENFPTLLDKVGVMMSEEYDWSAEVAALTMPVLLVYGDADSISPAHAAQFFELLGGGKRDADWNGSGMSNSRLAILPATTHYTVFLSPALVPIVTPFLDAPLPQAA